MEGEEVCFSFYFLGDCPAYIAALVILNLWYYPHPMQAEIKQAADLRKVKKAKKAGSITALFLGATAAPN